MVLIDPWLTSRYYLSLTTYHLTVVKIFVEKNYDSILIECQHVMECVKRITMSHSPVIIPSGSDMFHSVFTVRIISFSSFCVLESTAPNWIYPNKKHKHDNVKNRELVPIPSHVLKHPGLARITLVTHQGGRIVPLIAIRVLGWRSYRVVIACSWWLTTTRLHRNFD